MEIGGEMSTDAGESPASGDRRRGARGPEPDLRDLFTYRRGAEWGLVAAWGLELDLYRRLDDAPRSAVELAGATGWSARGLSILLEALSELGALRREGEAYRLTGGARARFLAEDTPDYSADSVRHWLVNVRTWAEDLGPAVRTGQPPEEEEDEELDEEERIARFQAAMASKDPVMVERVVEGALRRVRDPRRALDLGGGPGTFARRFAGRGLETVLMDRPEVVGHVSDAYGLAEVQGLSLVGGDFLRELPEGPFDVVILANITHLFNAETNRGLLDRLAERIRPGGVLAILDFVRGLSAFAPLFAITMLLNTEEGTTHGLDEYRSWLEEAGLGSLRWEAVDEDRHLLTARRAAGDDDHDGPAA